MLMQCEERCGSSPKTHLLMLRSFGQRRISLMEDALYLILGGCTAALTIWLIVRFVNRRSLAPVVIAAIPVLVLAVYVVPKVEA